MDRRADRRAFARIPLEIEVEVRGGEGEEPRWLTSRDISEGGMQLDFLPLPHNATLQLAFALPEERKEPEELPQVLLIDAEVAWRKMSSTGIRFSKLAPEERARLRAFLEGRAQA